MKYIKTVGFFLMKGFKSKKDPAYIIGVKPQEIVFYKDNQLICSIGMKRIRNAYLSDNKIVI